MVETLKNLKTPTARRLLITVVSAAIVLLNRKLGLDLSEKDILALAGLAVAYLAQSGFVAAATAKAVPRDQSKE